MEETQRFTAVLRDAGGGGAVFDVPPTAAGALAEAKRPETRARRVVGTLDRLREGGG